MLNKAKNQIRFAFFGSSEFSIITLNTLEGLGLTPSLIVTTPDKPKGRKLVITPTLVKIWAEKREIKVITPAKLDNQSVEELNRLNSELNLDLFVVASYGKIIPESVLDIPKYKCLNIHPSLLPKYRGASPIQSAILADDRNTGVSIMVMDKEMDHGPLIARIEHTPEKWPLKLIELKNLLGKIGAEKLAEIMPKWVSGEIKPEEQNHNEATFTKKITKEDGLINLSDKPYNNFLKFCAFSEWPKAYFFIGEAENKTRIIIRDADFKENKLIIKRVIPEGKKEIDFKDLVSHLPEQEHALLSQFL
jgi:methionyl-tRNA formyltransferase